MRILCDEPTSEVVRKVRQETIEGQASTSRPQRTKNMLARLHECVITSEYMVDDKCELVHYAFYENIEPVDATEALKDSRCTKAMVDEIKSIKDNDTWSLVGFPKRKKAVDVK